MPPFQNNTSLVVQRLDRAAALAVTTGLPRKCLVFGDDGAIQAIDATGVLRNIASSGGSIIPTDDNADDLGSAAKEWRIGFFGTKVVTPSVTAGGPAPFTDASLALVGVGTGVVNPQSPLVITPTVRSGAAATTGALEVIGAANTAVLDATEAPDVFFDLARTVTWAAGAGPLSDQRAVRITAPTYAGNAGTPLTITSAASFYINDAPTQGANMTLTNTYALWVDAGRVRFDGAVVQNVYPVLQTTGTLASPVTTINTPAGVTVVANGATTVTVTCAACTTATLITAVVLNTTTNTTTIRSVEPGAGSFVVRLTADPGASTAIIGVRISQPGTGV